MFVEVGSTILEDHDWTTREFTVCSYPYW